MKASNGWYSVHDTEHRPESGEEVLCLALIDYVKDEPDPFSDPANRIYYVATWYNAGDTMYDESAEIPQSASPEDRLMETIFGSPVPARADGFYIEVPDLIRRKNTDGGRLPEYAVAMRWERLAYDTEGVDGIVCWKPLDYPTPD